MSTFNEIVFFNHWHNGDLHYSRNFCRDIISQLENKYTFKYAHKNKPYTLEDLCEHVPIETFPGVPDMSISYAVSDNKLFINTWVGQKDCFFYKKVGYIGLETSYQMFESIINDINTEFNLNLKLNTDKEFYLAEIDFDKLKDFNPSKFTLDKRPILICNNFVFSNQAPNYDFTPLIDELAQIYKDEIFLVTNKLNDYVFKQPNVSYVDNLNLNEVGYLSLSAKVIVGRGSGPFCFADTKQNLKNTNTTFIGLGDSNFGYGKENGILQIFWGYLPSERWFFEGTADLNNVLQSLKTGIQFQLDRENKIG
jgi:hypothetical protein